MKQAYQVTITCGANMYKPISCLIEVEQIQGLDLTKDKVKKQEIVRKGINKICATRYWDAQMLKTYGYDKVKVRLYDKEKIEQEKRAYYEKVKQEKYASGEWKRGGRRSNASSQSGQ
jgi:hypothetical protein